VTTFSPRAQRNRRLYQRRRIFLGVGLLLTALIVWAGIAFHQFWNRPLSGVTMDGEEGGVAATPADKNHFTVLLLGADMRPDDIGRSDSILLAFVDLEKGAVKLLSFPRDSYVEIPGRGWDKINAAFSEGGMKLVKQTYTNTDEVPREKLNATFATGGARLVKKTVENLIGMPVDYWVTIDMNGFADIVDAVGGIDVVIDHDLDYEDPWDTPPLYIHLKAGAQRLQGIDALHFVRFRHDAQSDWGRMARQQQAIKALVQAATRPANLTRLPQLLKLGLENVHTNMSPSQVYGLADVAKKTISGDSISSLSLQGEDLWAPLDPSDPDSDEVYYTVLDFAKMRETVRELAGLPVDQKALEADRAAALAYAKAIPFGSADSGGWRSHVRGSDVAKDGPASGERSEPSKDTKPKPGTQPKPGNGNQPPGGGTQPPGGGIQPPGGGTQPPGDGTQPPGGGTQPPGGGTKPPGDGTQPPGDGTQPPGGGTQPPGDGTQPPPGDGTQPGDGGETPPSDGTPSGDGGQTSPGDGTLPPPGAQGAG
jgi:LCP family protein required for cell wall assembly